MDGYKTNALGHLVPVEQIKEVDLLRDDVVLRMVQAAKDMADELTAFKGQMTGDFDAFIDLSTERYGVQLGGPKGNIQLTSFCGKYRVTREIAERIEFDERLQAAKALVDECLMEWTKFTGSEVRALIKDAFQVDKRGRINARRILGLRKLEIDHPTWKKAMDAIADAVTITGTCVYHRFYERDVSGRYQQINLDFAAL